MFYKTVILFLLNAQTDRIFLTIKQHNHYGIRPKENYSHFSRCCKREFLLLRCSLTMKRQLFYQSFTKLYLACLEKYLPLLGDFFAKRQLVWRIKCKFIERFSLLHKHRVWRNKRYGSYDGGFMCTRQRALS